MEKIKEVVVPATKEHTKQVKVYVCDFCGHESTTTPGGGLAQDMGQCMICKRLCCRKYDKHCAISDPEEWGDYSGSYCPKCYELRFKKYKLLFDTMIKEYEKRQEDLIQTIKEESLSSK